MRPCFNICVKFKKSESDLDKFGAKVLCISVAANLFFSFCNLQEPARVGLQIFLSNCFEISVDCKCFS